MNLDLTRKLTLDLINPNCYNMIYAVQANSQTQYIAIKFTNDDDPYIIPDDAEIRVNGQNVIGHDIFSDCTIKNNKAILKLSEDIIHDPSRIQCELEIYIPATNEILYSIDFYIAFTSDSLESDPVTNSSEYSALVNTMMRAKLLIDKMRKNILIFGLIKKKWAAIKSDALETIEATNISKDNAIQATEDLRELEADVIESETDRKVQENTRESQEDARKSNEAIRKSNESNRQANENTRQNNENIRKSQETIREENEALRQSQENTRQDNESTRKANEIIRENSEDSRDQNEEIRKSNELDRQAQETDRQENESDRQSSEDTRENNESTRNANENLRQSQESIRQGNEDIRDDAEIIRIQNENARLSQETSRQDNENIRESNETTRQEQEADRQTNTADAVTNAKTATLDAKDATEIATESASNADEKASKADTAARRANAAAEGCEGILGVGVLFEAEKGAAFGVATLDDNSKLLSDQLPLGETTTTAFAGNRGKALENRIDILESDFSNNGEVVNLTNEYVYKCNGLDDSEMLGEFVNELVAKYDPTLPENGDINIPKTITIKVSGKYGVVRGCYIQQTNGIHVELDFGNAIFPTIDHSIIEYSTTQIGQNKYRYELFYLDEHSIVTLKNIDVEINYNTNLTSQFTLISYFFNINSSNTYFENININVVNYSLEKLAIDTLTTIFNYESPEHILSDHRMSNVNITNLSGEQVKTLFANKASNITMENVSAHIDQLQEYEDSAIYISYGSFDIDSESLKMKNCNFGMNSSLKNNLPLIYTHASNISMNKCNIIEKYEMYPQGRESFGINRAVIRVATKSANKFNITIKDSVIEASGTDALYIGGVRNDLGYNILIDNTDIILNTKEYLPIGSVSSENYLIKGITITGLTSTVNSTQHANRVNINPAKGRAIIRGSRILSTSEPRMSTGGSSAPTSVIGVQIYDSVNLVVEDSEIDIRHFSEYQKKTGVDTKSTMVYANGILAIGYSTPLNSGYTHFSSIDVVRSNIQVQLDGEGSAEAIKVLGGRANLNVIGCNLLTHSTTSYTLADVYSSAGINFWVPRPFTGATSRRTQSTLMTVRDTTFVCTTSNIVSADYKGNGSIVVDGGYINQGTNDTDYTVQGRLLIDGCSFCKNDNAPDSSIRSIYPMIAVSIGSGVRMPLAFTNNIVNKSTIGNTNFILRGVALSAEPNYAKIDEKNYIPQYSNRFESSSPLLVNTMIHNFDLYGKMPSSEPVEPI